MATFALLLAAPLLLGAAGIALAWRLSGAASRARLARERALENLDEGILILDEGGVLRDSNPAARALLGLQGEDAERRAPRSALDLRALAALAARGEGSADIQTAAGRTLRARAARLADGKGRPAGLAIALADVTEHLALLERLGELATLDALTGALNRRHFSELGERDLALSRREGRQTALLMIDLDHFKRVNDEHGHPAGDETLREVTRRCRSALRGSDLFCRYGGEEFAALLPGADAADALLVAGRLRALVSGEPILHEGGRITVTASVGVYAALPAVSDFLADFVKRADQALYHAKSSGRDCARLWTAPGT